MASLPKADGVIKISSIAVIMIRKDGPQRPVLCHAQTTWPDGATKADVLDQLRELLAAKWDEAENGSVDAYRPLARANLITTHVRTFIVPGDLPS